MIDPEDLVGREVAPVAWIKNPSQAIVPAAERQTRGVFDVAGSVP
jgi:hypothetical protein